MAKSKTSSAASKAPSTSTEVEVRKTTAVGAPLDFAADAGAGLESTDAKSFAIPFITILQGLSPQVVQRTVKDAAPGLFINTITNELFEELLVVPCSFQRRYIRWAPRSSGGGYKGDFDPIEVELGKVDGVTQVDGRFYFNVPKGASPVDERGRPKYDHLADTRNHFVLVKSKEGAWQPAIISLASTQIKKSRRWISRIQGLEMKDAKGKTFIPPSFSHIYVIKAVTEKNAEGEWFGWSIDLLEQVSDAELYAKAKAFHSSVVAGEVEVAPPQADPEEGGASGGDNGDRF